MEKSPPRLDRWDAAAIGSAVALLVFAHLVYPNHIFQYGVWLVVFCIWMAWFVYYGTKWIYGREANR